MESFYSIIYLKPNALSDEHLAVGLFTGGGEGPFLFLSESRMRLYKLITRKITYLAIQRLLNALKQKVDGYRGNQAELRLFDPLYSKEELIKLKKMSKGTVVFSEPTVINEWLNQEVHYQLVQQFLGEQKKKVLPKRSAFHLIWKRYVNQPNFDAYTRFATTKELKQEAEVNISVDLYHAEKWEVVKAIDFDLKPMTVEKKCYEFNLLSSIFTEHTLICVFPSPKTKEGKERLMLAQTDYPTVKFKKFRREF